MLIKFILVSSMFSFVCARSIENEVQLLTMFAGPRSDSAMDANETNIAEETFVQVPPTHTSRLDAPIKNHESTTQHLGTSRHKKRATNYKEDHRTDLRPGCCG